MHDARDISFKKIQYTRYCDDFLIGVIGSKITFLEQRLEEYHRNMERAKEDYEKPFQYEGELKQKLARQYQINAELDLDRESRSIEQSREEDRSEDERSEQDASRVAEEKTVY